MIITVMGTALVFLSSPAFANPSCGRTITESMTLTANIGPCAGNGIVIGAGNLVLNCAGHTILGSGKDDGIQLLASAAVVTVEGCKVQDFTTGYLVNSHSNILYHNSVLGDVYGITLDNVNGSVLAGNSCGPSAVGSPGLTVVICYRLVDGSSYNRIISNTAKGADYGFYLGQTRQNLLISNVATNCVVDGFYLAATSLFNSLGTNTANNNLHYGYYDLSSGGGTLGTRDYYSLNECSGNGIHGSQPLGLGTPQP